MIRTLALTIGLVACAGSAGAAAGSPPPPWIEAPTTQDIADAFPAKARAQKVGGDAVLSCTVKPDGRLRDCASISVSKYGYGFDVAARKVTAKFRLAGVFSLRSPTELQVRIAFPAAVLESPSAFVDQPAWSALPTVEDFQASFPKTANGVNDVRVVLDCAVAGGGALDDCKVASEAPVGEGYGAGALPLAAKFKVALLTPAGAPTVGGRVHVPIHYKLTQVAAPASH